MPEPTILQRTAETYCLETVFSEHRVRNLISYYLSNVTCVYRRNPASDMLPVTVAEWHPEVNFNYNVYGDPLNFKCLASTVVLPLCDVKNLTAGTHEVIEDTTDAEIIRPYVLCFRLEYNWYENEYFIKLLNTMNNEYFSFKYTGLTGKIDASLMDIDDSDAKGVGQ